MGKGMGPKKRSLSTAVKGGAKRAKLAKVGTALGALVGALAGSVAGVVGPVADNIYTSGSTLGAPAPLPFNLDRLRALAETSGLQTRLSVVAGPPAFSELNVYRVSAGSGGHTGGVLQVDLQVTVAGDGNFTVYCAALAGYHLRYTLPCASPLFLLHSPVGITRFCYTLPCASLGAHSSPHLTAGRD
jgi:hypothetical protein